MEWGVGKERAGSHSVRPHSMAKKANGRGSATIPLTATSPRPPLLPCRRSMRRSVGVAKEKQVGNIHEVTLEVVEEGQMEEDKEKEDEDKDDNEASQLREEEEEEEEEEESGGEGEK